MEADWRDDEMMAHALVAARTALAAGDYQVGAALVVNGELWGTARNALFSKLDTDLFLNQHDRIGPGVHQSDAVLTPCVLRFQD